MVPTRYEIDVAFEPERHFLRATAKVTLRVNQKTEAIEFELNRYLTLHSVTDAAGRTLEFIRSGRLNSHKLLVRLAGPAHAESELILTFAYDGALPVGPLDYITPDGILLRDESRWYPATDLAAFTQSKTTLHLPAGWEGRASGSFMDLETNKWIRLKTERPMSGRSVLANPGTLVCLEIRNGVVWSHPGEGFTPEISFCRGWNQPEDAYLTVRRESNAVLAFLGIVYGRKAQKANIFSKWGLARKFKKELETAMSLDPRHVDARMAMIDFHLEAPGIVGGDKKQAHALAKEILKIDPARGWLAKARIAQKEDRAGELESLYRKAVEADARNYRARMALASFYSGAAQAKHDLIETHAREAAGIAPGRIAAYSQLAALYARQQRWKDLDAILAQAEKNVFDDLSPNYQAAHNLIEKNIDLPRAERYLRKYLSQPPEPDAPSPAEGHWRLGQALEKQGRNDEAIRAYQEAVRLDSDLEAAKKDLKRIKR